MTLLVLRVGDAVAAMPKITFEKRGQCRRLWKDSIMIIGMASESILEMGLLH